MNKEGLSRCGWEDCRRTLWELLGTLEDGEPACSVEPPAGADMGRALAALHEHELDAMAAFDEWLQGHAPLCASGVGARLLRLRLEAAANLARCLGEARLPTPPGWSERQRLSWLVRECFAQAMQPVLDRLWLEFHGIPEE